MSDESTIDASSPDESDEEGWAHPLEECVLIDIESLITVASCDDIDVTRPLLSSPALSLGISLFGEQA